MRYMIIRGNVVGGHQVRDLGLQIPYQKEVVIPEVRAGWSRDLSEALRTKAVIRVGMRDTPSPIAPQPEVPAIARNNRNVPAPKRKKNYQPPPRVASPEERQIKELSQLNADLLAEIRGLVEAQKMTTDLLQKALESGLPVHTLPGNVSHGNAVPNMESEAGVESEDLAWKRSEPVMFIPSKIRSESTKISDNPLEPTQESSEVGEKMEASMEALKKLKRKGKKAKEADK